ncbi:pirin family protein [Kordiimonas lipolytica]|uniref:Pirin family protein n=1 Tax=Kordiimonas lipolytica TaxID=1662421 RepID=A0ABV8U794_9PROT|nr:pirin family protein [Kordiimonas lipolytica]
MNRKIKTLFEAVAMAEGQGVTVHRSIGRKGLMNLDPFLLLDEMELPKDARGAGFPEHPHRGFETVTYMLSGKMRHGDTSGNSGVIGPGDAQWMTAGRGIVHSEMPVASGEDVRGFQLWVNLPGAKKMIPPRYQDVSKNEIPTVSGDGYEAHLIAGDLNGHEGPVRDIAVKPFYGDITLTGEEATLPVPKGHTAFLYGIQGGLSVKGQSFPTRTLAILSDGDSVTVKGRPGARFLMIAGAPIGEPIARYGPFVMTTREEILNTLEDWGKGRFLNPN